MKNHFPSTEIIRWYVTISNADTTTGFKTIYLTDLEKDNYITAVSQKMIKIMIKGEEYLSRDILLRRIKPEDINRKQKFFLEWQKNEKRRQSEDKMQIDIQNWIEANNDRYKLIKNKITSIEMKYQFWKTAKANKTPYDFEKYFSRHITWLAEAEIKKILDEKF